MPFRQLISYTEYVSAQLWTGTLITDWPNSPNRDRSLAMLVRRLALRQIFGFSRKVATVLPAVFCTLSVERTLTTGAVVQSNSAAFRLKLGTTNTRTEVCSTAI